MAATCLARAIDSSSAFSSAAILALIARCTCMASPLVSACRDFSSRPPFFNAVPGSRSQAPYSSGSVASLVRKFRTSDSMTTLRLRLRAGFFTEASCIGAGLEASMVLASVPTRVGRRKTTFPQPGACPCGVNCGPHCGGTVRNCGGTNCGTTVNCGGSVNCGGNVNCGGRGNSGGAAGGGGGGRGGGGA